MSEAVAVILIVTYGFSLLFTLRTHRPLFGGEPHPMEGPVWGPGKAVAHPGLATVGSGGRVGAAGARGDRGHRSAWPLRRCSSA